jgi:hypothetical protein
MPDYTARRRLKKKMLDRWENEGGIVCNEPATGDKTGPTNDHLSEHKQLSASHDNSTGGMPASPTRKHKPTQK